MAKMIKLNQHQCTWVEIYWGLTKADMPTGINKTTLKDHIKGKTNFVYQDIWSSVVKDSSVKNKRKVDQIGNQFTFMLQEALEDEEYEICKNLAEYFKQVNIQIESLNQYYLNQLANGKA